MEELLNKLLERGWKPRGRNKELYRNNRTITLHITIYDCDLNVYLDGGFMNEDKKSFRELVSRESGLWQFCIANHLLKKYSDLGDDDEYIIGRWQNGMDGKTTDGEYIDENYDSDIYHQDESYQRWLIESSLKDEDELESFILDNIKVEGN